MTSPLAPRGEGWGAGVRPVPAPHEARYSQSVERGLGILGCFTPERPNWGVRELSRELQVSYSTMQRYLGTLVALGFLERVGNGLYRTTLGVTRLGLSTMSSMGLYGHAHDEIVELAYRVGHSVVLAVLDGTEIVIVDWVETGGDQTCRVNTLDSCRRRLPIYCTALGKVLLAFLPEYARRELLGEIALSRCASGTIVSRRVMRQELAEVAATGHALAESELAEGLLAVAVPLREEGGQVVAALGLIAPSATAPIENMVAALGPHLQATADRISARLGHRHAHEGPRCVKWRFPFDGGR